MRKKLLFITFFLLALLPVNAQLIDFDDLETGSVTDAEGNVYKTILLDETWWMAENLKTRIYNDGTDITQMTKVIDDTDGNTYSYWNMMDRWVYPAFDSTAYDDYGLLYSWTACNNTTHGGICPEGWSLTDTSDWFNLGRLIVGSDYINWDEGTRNTPQGGTETYYEVSSIKKIARYIKSDNGTLWKMEPTISSDCNGSGLNIVPSGKICYSVTSLGYLADYWTSCYVHSDSSGMGRRFVHFEYDNHNMIVDWNFNGNMQCVRCVKAANVLKVATSSIVLDTAAQSADTINVTANYNWLASTNASWLTVSQTVDSADGSIIVTATSKNSAASARTDTLFVTMDDAKTKTIIVTQAGTEPLFSVSDTTLKVLASENSSVTFSISSNVEWTIESSGTWLTPNINSGSDNAVITLTAEANPDTIVRVDTISVESDVADTLVQIVVVQSAKTIESLTKVVIEYPDVTDITVYPNPVNSLLKIDSDTDVLKTDVISLSGKIVLSQVRTDVINVESLTPGLYLIKITTSEGVVIKKVVKQ